MPRRNVALVAGASGIVGYRLANLLVETGNWDVIGVTRTSQPTQARFKTVLVDLTNIDDCCSKLSNLTGVTHLFYAAKYNVAGDQARADQEPTDRNLSMLANTLEIIDKKSKSLKHVHLVHGTGYYGPDLSHRKTPFKEDDPRWLGNNFYYAQQDFIADRQKDKRWAWSISRPQLVCDHLSEIARSVPLGIAVYASISKASGMPLSFPGHPRNYTAIRQCTDASQLAKAIVWMATHEKCSNEVFNVTNGDYFRWENIWPKLADCFGMTVGPVRDTKLAKIMSDRAHIWDALGKSHMLQKTPYNRLVVWDYLDKVFACKYDQMSDVTKLRKFGFHDVVDTEDMLFKFMKSYRRARTIPR